MPNISDQFDGGNGDGGGGGGGGRRKGVDGIVIIFFLIPPATLVLIKFSCTNFRSALVAEFNGYLAAASLTTAQKNVSLPNNS